MNRRNFIAMSLAAAGAYGKDRFPTEPRKRLAVSTYPFRHRIASPHRMEDDPATSGMTLAEFAGTIVPKLNVPGIEPWSHHFQSTEPEYVRGLRKSFEAAGLHVVNIPVDVGVRLCGDAAERTKSLEVWHKWVDAAVLLGSPSVRVHLPHGESGGKIDCAVSALRELAAYGATKNVVINLENDEPETEQPEQIVRVIKAVNSPFLHALPDFCNSMLVHDDQAYNNAAMSQLFPLAFNISHVKDMESDGKKVYRVNVNEIFAIAKRSGYKGYFSMEWEGTGDDYEGTRRLIEASLRALGRER